MDGAEKETYIGAAVSLDETERAGSAGIWEDVVSGNSSIDSGRGLPYSLRSSMNRLCWSRSKCRCWRRASSWVRKRRYRWLRSPVGYRAQRHRLPDAPGGVHEE